MAQTLHEVDEETDVGAYQAYLRAQSNGDLFDIVQHLDPERYPARLDAAQREFRRRHVMSLPVYTANEYAIRYTSLFAFGLAAATMALTLLLTAADAAGPAWPTAIPDGTTALTMGCQFLEDLLRAVVSWGDHLAAYPIVWAALGTWALTGGVKIRRGRARADVWRLALTAWVMLTAAMLLADAPDSAIPDLFSKGDWPRPFTLWDPFG